MVMMTRVLQEDLEDHVPGLDSIFTCLNNNYDTLLSQSMLNSPATDNNHFDATFQGTNDVS